LPKQQWFLQSNNFHLVWMLIEDVAIPFINHQVQTEIVRLGRATMQRFDRRTENVRMLLDLERGVHPSADYAL